MFSWLFHDLKMHLLAHLGLCTNQNDRFPYPFIYRNKWNPYPFIIIPKPLKRFPFQAEPLRIGHYRKFSPPGKGGSSVILPRVRVGYELAIIISYPTSASGIIVLLKTPTKYREFFPTLFVKTTDFQLVFNFEQTHTVTIFGEHGIMAYILLWLSQSELQNCIIQWFSF